MPANQPPAGGSKLANALWAAIRARPLARGQVLDKAKVSWGDGPAFRVSAATGYTFVVALIAFMVGFLSLPDNLEWAKLYMDWIEGWRVGGSVSFLDWCGSCMVCFGYRKATEKALQDGDVRTKQHHRSLLAHHATTLATCAFLQFGGTSTTGLFLGQVWSWSCGNHVILAFLMAWWLTFSCPFDVWYRMMRNPWVHIPIKSFATISAAHAVTSWGLEKAIVADHERMRKSVFGALVCGYLSGCFGWAVVAFFETGGALIRSAGPTWAMQRTFYMVSLYYLMTDPHGNLGGIRRGIEPLQEPMRKTSTTILSLLEHLSAAAMLSDSTGFPVPGEAVSKSAGKVIIACCHLVFTYALDIVGLDLMVSLNRALAAVTVIIAPNNMHLPFHPSLEAATQASSKDSEQSKKRS